MPTDDFVITIFVRPGNAGLKEELAATVTDHMAAIRSYEMGQTRFVDASVSTWLATPGLENIGDYDAKILVASDGVVETTKTKRSRNRFVRELFTKTFPEHKIEVVFGYNLVTATAESFVRNQVEPTKKELIAHTVELILFRKIIETLEHELVSHQDEGARALLDSLDAAARKRFVKLLEARTDAAAQQLLSWSHPSTTSV